jgi:putative endonuclease
MADQRRKTGVTGERLARRHLERAGYEILDQNFRTRHGELDLVAADDRGIVF